jgi:hypothetical protein
MNISAFALIFLINIYTSSGIKKNHFPNNKDQNEIDKYELIKENLEHLIDNFEDQYELISALPNVTESCLIQLFIYAGAYNENENWALSSKLML